MARILVVDDSAVVRRMLGLVLGDAGHEVSFAVNGQLGLAALSAARYVPMFWTPLSGSTDMYCEHVV